MGKQTKKKGSHFGGEWTVQKLHIIESYLNAYTTALKHQNVKKIYVDGFAGSGKTELKTSSGDVDKESITVEAFVKGKIIELEGNSGNDDQEAIAVEGSALISLKYDFDEYYFLELDEDRIALLKENVKANYPEKANKVHFITGDCNKELSNVISRITVYHRCLMFLDPYALELKWETLEKISKCGVVDLWYLFPLSVIRLMAKDKEITEGNKEKVTSILGTDEWLNDLFVESQQITFSGDSIFERVDYDDVLTYIKARFLTIFPFVSPHSKLLKNETKKSPMFMLCFMMTNTSKPAQKLASKLVKDIISGAERL